MENENNNNFIDHKDPTKPINLEEVSLEKQYSTLTDREKYLAAAKCLGMNHLPVDIRTFLFDDYFLGVDTITNHGKAVFPYWLDKFDQMFPNPIINRFPYISFGGCIGSGKSFASRVIGLYQFHKLDCCSNVFASLGLAGGTKIAMGFFHSSSETAEKDFVNYFKTVYNQSPYFRQQYNNPPVRLIPSGPKSTGAVLGTQLIFTVLSEVGFWKPNDAKEKIDEVIGRFHSRFMDKRNYFGGIVCDSSAKFESGASDYFEESVFKNELFTIKPAHWEVRPGMYEESQGETFMFYRGDAKIMPRIIKDGEDTSALDKDRIIHVPKQLEFEFRNNPVRALNDRAGIPYTIKDLLFAGDLSHLMSCSSQKNYIPEIIDVDFYDKSDTIYDKVAPMIWRIPKHTNLFIHYDIGLKKDISGIAACYFDKEIVDPNGSASYPTFIYPFIFGVSRKKGQATSLDHLYQFLKDLIKNGYHVTFSADSFASAGIFQSCERDGIEYKSISMDKTMDACIMFKNVISTDRATLPYNNVLLRECSEVRVVTQGQHVKIDHPTISSCVDFDYKNCKSGTMPGTKDLFDAACGAMYSCYLSYSERRETGASGGFVKSLEALKHITASSLEETQKRFQNMIEDIY